MFRFGRLLPPPLSSCFGQQQILVKPLFLRSYYVLRYAHTPRMRNGCACRSTPHVQPCPFSRPHTQPWQTDPSRRTWLAAVSTTVVWYGFGPSCQSQPPAREFAGPMANCLSYCSASTFDKARQPRVRHARYEVDGYFHGVGAFPGGPKTGTQTSCRAEPFADGLSRANDGGFEVTESGHFLSS